MNIRGNFVYIARDSRASCMFSVLYIPGFALSMAIDTNNEAASSVIFFILLRLTS